MIDQCERQLLARGAELAGGCVEQDERAVLQQSIQAVRSRQLSVRARVGDCDLVGLGGRGERRLRRDQQAPAQAASAALRNLGLMVIRMPHAASRLSVPQIRNVGAKASLIPITSASSVQ